MKHALITGGAKRIGRCIALELAENGWDITIHYHTSKSEAHLLAKEIKEMGQKAHLICADFEKLDEVKNLFTQLSTPITALVNNVSLFEYDEKDPDGSRHKLINVTAPLIFTDKLFAQLPKGQKGTVVHLLDNTPLSPELSAYAKSRKELESSMMEYAYRYAPRVRINAVALGPSLQNPCEPDEHFQGMVLASPLIQPSYPQDVACSVRFLLENGSITGQTLNVDSGLHILKNT